MPKQGKHAPWKVSNNYLADRKELKNSDFIDTVLQFKKQALKVQEKPRLVS